MIQPKRTKNSKTKTAKLRLNALFMQKMLVDMYLCCTMQNVFVSITFRGIVSEKHLVEIGPKRQNAPRFVQPPTQR
jgi:hypothetical protein